VTGEHADPPASNTSGDPSADQAGETTRPARAGSRVRVERDSLGTIEVDASRYWGAQTERSIRNFPIGRPRFVWGRPVIHAVGVVKRATTLANRDLGQLAPELAAAIVTAADEVIAGDLDDHFPLVVWQTGSGTHTNMNANEVLANRAIEILGGALGSKDPVHPNDHVNLGQSSNDVFPTVMHVAVASELRHRLYPATDRLLATLGRLADRHRRLVKVGRTHMQDATPITFGQEIEAWAAPIADALDRLRTDEETVRHRLAIGGTATGTGLNSHPELGPTVCRLISEQLHAEHANAGDRLAVTSSHDTLVQVSAGLRTLAGAVAKMANDIRWLASGPRAGIGELRLPANEPGSSIMPGKVNPSQVEALTMVAAQVFGNDATVALAGAQGHLQLNACKPVILHNVLESVALLADSILSFDEHCLDGLTPDVEQIADHLERNLMMATALNPHIGYDKAAKVAKRAWSDGTSLEAAGAALGYFTAEEYRTWVDPEAMTRRRFAGDTG
jgi:fumarate hydratase class II